MARHPAEFEFEAVFPGTGLRTAVHGDAAQAVVSALTTAAVAADAVPADLDDLDRAVRQAASHLARHHGVDAQRVEAVFNRIVSDSMPGPSPTGTSLLHIFLSGPLSWPRRVLASNLPADPLALLEAEDFGRLPGRLAVTDALIDSRTPLHTRKELARVLAEFASHLEQNAEPLVRTGHPATVFARCPWLDIRLNKLYPVKIPVAVRVTAANPRGAYDPRYVEGRRVALPLSRQKPYRRASPLSPVLELQVVDPCPPARPAWGRWRGFDFAECGYGAADTLPELHEDDVQWLESIRPAVQDVKVRVVAALAKTLSSGKGGAAVERVIGIVADRMNAEQVGRLLRLDGKYQTYTAFTDAGGVDPLPCMPGGLSAVIELAGHVEKDLEVGTICRARDALAELVVSDLLGRPRLRSGDHAEPYFALAAANADRWRSAVDVYTEREEEEPAFWMTFRDRVKEGIAAQVPQPFVVPVKPKYADVIQPAVVNSVRTLSCELDDGVLSPDMLRPSAKKRPVARFPMMDGLRWSEVTITFVSNDSVRITARDRRESYTFAQLGFADRRKGDRPDLVWEFFHGVAKAGGELSWSGGRGASPELQKKAPSYFKAIRQRLRAVFSIEDDPFENYKKAKAYRPKFKLNTTAYEQHDSHDEVG